jgi:hypothetical protein
LICKLILSIHNYQPNKDYTNESIEIYSEIIELEKQTIENFEMILKTHEYETGDKLKNINLDFKTIFAIILNSYYIDKTLVSTIEITDEIINKYVTHMSDIYQKMKEYYEDADIINNPNKTIIDKTLIKLNMSKNDIQMLYSLCSNLNAIDMDVVSFYKLFRYPYLHTNEQDYDDRIKKEINMFNVLYIFNGGNYHGKTYELWLREVYE